MLRVNHKALCAWWEKATCKEPKLRPLTTPHQSPVITLNTHLKTHPCQETCPVHQILSLSGLSKVSCHSVSSTVVFQWEPETKAQNTCSHLKLAFPYSIPPPFFLSLSVSPTPSFPLLNKFRWEARSYFWEHKTTLDLDWRLQHSVNRPTTWGLVHFQTDSLSQ